MLYLSLGQGNWRQMVSNQVLDLVLGTQQGDREVTNPRCSALTMRKKWPGRPGRGGQAFRRKAGLMDSGVSECQAFRNEGGTLFQNAGSFTRIMHFDPEVANEELDLFGSLADGCSVDRHPLCALQWRVLQLSRAL